MTRDDVIVWLGESCLTGDPTQDAPSVLTARGYPRTAAHCADVAAEAARLSARFAADGRAAAWAGWLHDVGALVPPDARVEVARVWGIAVLPEEASLPMILHQKLAVPLAREGFGVQDIAVLSAIGCHTTLKPGASLLDKVVFLADKIAWDQVGPPPYLDAVQIALERSLDAAICVYLRYLWERRATLPVVHPWFVAAYRQVCGGV
jgi:predicted HD superfamily hydrolase involved in NAD metabolism